MISVIAVMATDDTSNGGADVGQENTDAACSSKSRVETCIECIVSLLEKYSDNDIALERIQKLCVDIIPHSIEAYVSQQETRESRLTKLREKSEWFMRAFLDSAPEYYYFQNNTFVSYDGENYSIISEDQISNRIVKSLSDDTDLACRKHKIKSAIIKRIREKGTSQAVPSSSTIQRVLHPLYPSIFETRNETKYFLTILGDVLTRKHCDLTYFVHHRAKEFIDYIISGLTFLKASSATALANLFKYKFQNHAYATSRVIRIQGEGDSLYYPNIDVIDLFFVAQYYSNRYENADNLLRQPSFTNVARHAMILVNLGTEEQAIRWFASEALVHVQPHAHTDAPEGESQHNPSSEHIDTKTVQYMWKRFCQKMKIPIVVQIASVIPTLLSIEPYKSSYVEEQKVFKGFVGNRQYNPSVGLFLKFWDDTMKVTSTPGPPHSSTPVGDAGTGTDADNEYGDFEQLEIDEVATLFNSWVRKRGQPTPRTGVTILDEDEILSCIKHFFPSVTVQEAKYINGVTCSLWNKKSEVSDYIETSLELTGDTAPPTSESLYRAYCNQTLRTGLCVASKGYFERVYDNLT